MAVAASIDFVVESEFGYNRQMIRAYDQIVDFIAAGVTPGDIASFEASRETKEFVEQLIAKQKAGILTVEEASELEHYLQFEHLMRLAKARARGRLDDHVRQS